MDINETIELIAERCKQEVIKELNSKKLIAAVNGDWDFEGISNSLSIFLLDKKIVDDNDIGVIMVSTDEENDDGNTLYMGLTSDDVENECIDSEYSTRDKVIVLKEK